MKKLNKQTLKNLIMEEIANPARNIQPSKTFAPTLGSEYIQNYRNGVPPDNNNKLPAYERPPYETGELETHIKGGELYVTQGKNKFNLVFNNDELTSGTIEPTEKFGFYIQNGMIVWHDSTPANVRNDADLCKQILDYSGREQ